MDVVGRGFISDILAEKQDNGDWTVTVLTGEKRLQKGGEWEYKDISTTCTDTNFEQAYTVAVNATMEKFDAVLKENKNLSLFPDDTEALEESDGEAVETEEPSVEVEEVKAE